MRVVVFNHVVWNGEAISSLVSKPDPLPLVGGVWVRDYFFLCSVAEKAVAIFVSFH